MNCNQSAGVLIRGLVPLFRPIALKDYVDRDFTLSLGENIVDSFG